MPEIHLLTKETIDKIAAGEVVERPASVVKELVENAIDADSSAVTVEIKDGGTTLIRITDNGCGIERNQLSTAFMRHSTSKIKEIEDLLSVSSLGFRGEALSSIAAVSRVELITKTEDSLTGSRYVIEGSEELANEEIGAPDGTTFLVRDIFYNIPARKKFLKSNQTEAAYISDIVEKLALSHPDVSFKYILNNQTKLHTSGNGNLKDIIYHIYGREIAASLIPIDFETSYFTVSGFVAKPNVSRGNRNYEVYYINGRYIKSKVIAKAIEEAYKNFMMQHQYPFTMLYFTFPGQSLDVNVHPQKMEIRFDHQDDVYRELYKILYNALSGRELIPSVPVEEKTKQDDSEPKKYAEPIPEPFEKRRLNDIRQSISRDTPYEPRYLHREIPQNNRSARFSDAFRLRPADADSAPQGLVLPESPRAVPKSLEVQTQKSGPAAVRENFLDTLSVKEDVNPVVEYHEMTLAEVDNHFLTEESLKKHRIIGQLFDTYWMVEFDEKLYIIDQHAAHEKVLYERTMKLLEKHEITTQMISPPIFITLDAKEEKAYLENQSYIEELGYIIENFGGREYIIRGIPGNLFHLDMKDLFTQMLDDFYDFAGRKTPELIKEKVASMSCKAAVKGNNKLSLPEVDELIRELLSLENPYHCPHGRPTIISMTKYEIEKKFKRIV